MQAEFAADRKPNIHSPNKSKRMSPSLLLLHCANTTLHLYEEKDIFKNGCRSVKSAGFNLQAVY